MAKTPRVSVLERRLRSPFGTGGSPILLKDKGWTVRVVNAGKKADHVYQMQAEKGWVFVQPEDLAAPPEQLGFAVSDGRVVRGDRGQEVLMKMPLRDFKQIQLAKNRKNLEGMGNSKKVKEQLADAAANQFGAEAGEFIAESVVGEVIDGKERMVSES